MNKITRLIIGYNRNSVAMLLMMLLGFVLSNTASGQSAGFNTTYAVLSINGGGNTYYDLQAATGNPDFQGNNLGTFCQGNTTGIVFKGAEHNVYKCGGCDLTSTRIYYRIYPTGSPSGSFVSNNIGFTSGFNNGCGGQDQQWSNTGYNTDLLAGLGGGNYTLEVYSDASVTCVGGTVFASNGGNNYKATFTVNATSVGGAVTGGTAICSGSTSGLLTLAGQTGTVVRWESSVSPFSIWTPIVTTATTYTSGALTQTTRFRAVVKNGVCAEIASSDTTVTVDPISVGGAVTGGTTICSGSTSGLLTLAGQTGAVVRWESSVSPFSIWTPIVTTATTYTSGALTQTTRFRAVVQNGVCAEIASSDTTVSIETTTWTSAGGGSWDNGLPTSTKAAVISFNYSEAADITACSLTVNNSAVVTIPSTFNVNLGGPLTVSSGSFTLENNANLLQADGVTNSGNITVKRNSNALLRFDYTLWSSPVTGSQTLFNFSPLTSNTPPTNIRFYTYNPTTNLYNAVTTATTSTFDTGTGYLIRVPFNHPTAPAVWTGSFVGVPNNGPVTLNSLTSGLFYGIGNPYPSTIDADLFITANGLTDALYFWRKTNGAAGSAYATYTLAGGASPAPGTGASPSSVIPNGIIQIGQGFIAKATSSTFSFTNAMRVADNANQFFRTTPLERNRIWLNLTNTSGFFSQTMIAYMTNATMGVDASIDGKYFNDSQTALTSIVNNEEYAVQGRALPFVTSDVVPLGFKSETAGTYSLSIDSVDGLFSSTNQVIYLRDNLTSTVHNLSSGAYTFSTLSGVFNSRFDVLFENSVLGVENPNFTANNVSVYNNNNELVINSTSLEIKEVKVFDIRGRLLVEKSNINANEARLNVGVSNQVLVVQITSTNNDIVVKKVVN